MGETNTAFNWADPLLLEAQLSAEERMVRDAAHAYAQGSLAPRLLEAFRNESTDAAVFREMGELGLLGATILLALFGDLLITPALLRTIAEGEPLPED